MVTSLALSYVVTRDAGPAQSELERLATEGTESEVPTVPPADGGGIAPTADAPPVVIPADDAAAVPQGPPPAN
jgi:hypothetical protein